MDREHKKSSIVRPRDDAEGLAVTRGSGDIFADLGINLSEEDRVKIGIAVEISRVIQAKRLTQARAATVLGTDQAKVSKITRGLVSGFSAERLMAFLLALGVNVDIRTSDSAEAHGRVTINGPARAAG